MNLKDRILVISHAHPDFSLGGGELAAYNLYKAYQANAAVEDANFLARVDRGRGATGHITLRRPNEYLWEQAVENWHMMKAAHQESLVTWFSDLVRALRPTIVHAHHYAHLGLEFLRVIKHVDPSIRIMMTLHEYMAICSNNGQMLKTSSMRLCSRESFDECHACFPERSPEDFWLRKHYFGAHFDLVDTFVAPSNFLKQRYVAWGIPEAKIVVIENGQNRRDLLPPRPLDTSGTRNRLGFFGQVNPYKGLDVVLEALTQMKWTARQNVLLEVHGANLDKQSPEFQDKVRSLLGPLIKEGTVQWVGPYEPDQLPGRMATIDWVLVPSIWWENSPMVIQEAFANGRPVICSDIGGMAEKVTHGKNGMHVSVGNVAQWAQSLSSAVQMSDEWDRLREGISAPISHAECADAHLELLQAVPLPAVSKRGKKLHALQ